MKVWWMVQKRFKSLSVESSLATIVNYDVPSLWLRLSLSGSAGTFRVTLSVNNSQLNMEEPREVPSTTNTLNYMQILFSSLSLNIILLGSLINTFEKYLPVLIKRAFRYGKFSCEEESKVAVKMEVPKSWFRHFYVMAVILSSGALYLMVNCYFFGGEVPVWLFRFLDSCCGILRQASGWYLWIHWMVVSLSFFGATFKWHIQWKLVFFSFRNKYIFI